MLKPPDSKCILPAVDRLNYHHLLYFWMVAREGTVSRAAAELRLSQPAVSAQIRTLEAAIGEPLFARAGRGLRLTEVGQLVFEHAQGIFALGRDLTEALKGRAPGRALRIGVADVVPKLIAFRLISPALRLAAVPRLVVREDRPDRLFGELGQHRLDAVLTDAPPATQPGRRLFSHLLGECAISVFAAPTLARRLRRGFPGSLDGEPFLMPLEGTALRRTLESAFHRLGVAPRVAGEFDDSALVKSFGEAGVGAFPAPEAIERSVVRQYRVQRVGRLSGTHERYYVVTVERKFAHPGVAAISAAAQADLFG